MKKLLLFLLLPLTLFGQSQKISDMTSATSLTGSEYVPIVQTTNKKSTVTLLRGWASTIGTAGQLLKVNSGATALEFFSPSYIVGPASSTDNTLAIFDGTTGKLIGEAVSSGLRLKSDGTDLQWSKDSPVSGNNFIRAASGISGSTAGLGLLLRGGYGFASGNTDAGDVIIQAGIPNGSGAVGAVKIAETTDKLSFFNVTPVVKQSAVNTTQGISDALTAYGLLPSSTITDGVIDDVVSGTTLTLDNDDHGKLIYFTNTGAITVTVPTGLLDGFYCMLVQDNTGAISVSASGTTLNGTTSTSTQYDVLTISNYKAANTYIIK